MKDFDLAGFADYLSELIRNLDPISPARAAELHGYATYYELPGHSTASGPPFDANAMTAAMTPDRAALGTQVQVQLQSNPSHSISVRVNNTGPWKRGPDGRALRPYRPDLNIVIDKTPAAFASLTGSLALGKVPVIITVPDHPDAAP